MKVLLIVGHQPWAKGAHNAVEGLYEYDFNEPLAYKIASRVKKASVIVDHYTRGADLVRWSGKSDLLLELHCNAFNSKASGTLTLYANGSVKGRAAAGILQTHFVEELDLPDRGILPRTAKDRGGYLLWGVSQPALIGEPFFIDNDGDLLRARQRDLAGAYAGALDRLAEVWK